MCKALLEEQAKVQVYDPQVKRSQMFVEFDYTCGVNKDNTPRLEESVRAERGKEKKHVVALVLEKSYYIYGCVSFLAMCFLNLF